MCPANENISVGAKTAVAINAEAIGKSHPDS